MVKVLVTDNVHLYRTLDGKYYTPSIYDHTFFSRYLAVFDEVRFVAKTKYVDHIDPSKYIRADYDRVEICELPWYQGLRQMVRHLPELVKRFYRICDGCDCFIFRVGQVESYFAYLLGRKKAKPYAVEVVNDPASSLNMGRLLRWASVFLLKVMVSRANGVAYVTHDYLQRLYPRTARDVKEEEKFFESSYSSIDLDECEILAPRKYPRKLAVLRIIHVANAINDDLKGHWTVINAVKLLVQRGCDVHAEFVGDGVLISQLRCYVDNAGLAGNIAFIGRLSSRKEVMRRLVGSDLFVFPSYSEGLPRVIIEAQATGLPCLASPVGGIPELIDSRYLIRPGDFNGYAAEIQRLISSPRELEEMSRSSIKVAQRYTRGCLSRERTQFYSKLRRLTEERYWAGTDSDD